MRHQFQPGCDWCVMCGADHGDADACVTPDIWTTG